jgi:hypothetical protein
MALMRFHNVLVTRDANTIIPKQVSAWELAVLEEMYGEGSIVVSDEVVRELAVPDVEPEMARLARIYGTEEDSKTPFVEIVYGRSTNGLRQLKKAIEQSIADEEGEAKRGPGRPKKEAA